MAKIKSLTIFKKDRTTNKVLLHFSVDIRVNSSGVFLAKLPTEIEDKLGTRIASRIRSSKIVELKGNDRRG